MVVSERKEDGWTPRFKKEEVQKDLKQFKELDKWVERSLTVSDESLRRRV